MISAAPLDSLLILPLPWADLSEAAELEARYFPVSWSLEQYQEEVERGTCQVHGVRGETGLVGYVSCLVLPPEMEIVNMAVTAALRCRGLGRALVQAALEHGAGRGVELCHLEVDETNIPALRLYAALGFRQTGRRRGYYQGAGKNNDAILMQCVLKCP